ncbi:MAG: PaeR7I family type II restriction endonuclease [Verrucomicrobiota bacterium]
MSPPSETDLFHHAIKHWWASKKGAAPKNAQGGTRDANLHGKTMDGFAATIRDFLLGLNVKSEHIFSGGHLTKTPSILPSYYRPSKNWDLIVLGSSRFHPAQGDQGEPVLYGALEFKSQDKSIGNNQNNRLEESLGNALDFWTTYEHSGFERQLPRPWLGYLFVGKYNPDADGKSVRIEQPHFLAMPPFRTEGSDNQRKFAGPSYAERYKIFMKQSVGARLYDAGAFIVTDEAIAGKKINHRIPLAEFGSANFLRSLKAQILAHYPEAMVKPGSIASLI